MTPLPGTDRSRRLMCSGKLFDPRDPGILLVKKEWDEADAWLTEQIDNKQQ